MYHLLGFVLGSSCLLYIGSPYGFGLGSNWLLYIGVPLIIGIWAQIRVSSAFSRWSKVRVSANITGAECAREILQAAQIHDVNVVETNDFLGDHYDPTKKQLHLSSNVYNTPSVAALGIAAHESGHAIQHARAYAPLKARMAIVPVTMIASQMLPFIIIGGLFFGITGLITLGIWCYLILLVFQLITLPVEFDASRRAKIILREMGVIQPGEEAAGVNSVLNAAALTYIAAFIAALGNLLWLMSLRDRRGSIARHKKWITPSLYLLAALPICYRRVCSRVLSLSGRRWISQEATQTRSW
jgi:Zn-dependent membrane protease YugP